VDFRRFVQAIRQYKAVVALTVLLGVAAGIGYTLARPPLMTSSALVELPSSKMIQTEVLIAKTPAVLVQALPKIHPAVTLAELQKRVQVSNVTSNVLQITGSGSSAGQAEGMANAVARSYLQYIDSASSPGGKVAGSMLEPASIATGKVLTTRILIGLLGLVIGLLVGAIIAVAISRSDRRLRERDDIADAVGIPVLASIPVRHPSDTAGWIKLLDSYEPEVVHAWSLRKALRQLGLTDFRGTSSAGASLTVFTLSSDRGALALGPQLAAFAASLGIPTSLVIGPQQDHNVTATLVAACRLTATTPTGRRFNMKVIAGEEAEGARPLPAGLTVVVSVVDGRTPQVEPGTMRTTVSVLGVSSGKITAEQLARVAVSTAHDGRDIAAIVVADPDPTDITTGRLPQPARAARRRLPAHVTGITTETRQ
jgi:capsular polysaccharide biosynthesis protein